MGFPVFVVPCNIGSLLGVIVKGSAGNAEDMNVARMTPGMYGIGPDTLNKPAGINYGKCVVFPGTNNNDELQIAINVSSGNSLAVRSGNASVWYEFAKDN